MHVLKVVDVSNGNVEFYLGKDFSCVLYCWGVAFLWIVHLGLVDTARQYRSIRILCEECLSDQVLLLFKLVFYIDLDLLLLLDQLYLFHNLRSRCQLLWLLVVWEKLLDLATFNRLHSLSFFLHLRKVLFESYGCLVCFCVKGWCCWLDGGSCLVNERFILLVF